MLKELPGSKSSIPDSATGALIFLTVLLVFWLSPVHQITDSHYSMLLSETLLKHRSFALDHFNLPRLEPNASTRDYYVMNGDIWQLELAGGHIYYYFPPGSSVLSLPAVAIANALGVSAVNADGTYNPRGEAQIEFTLAAMLMALLTAVFYFTSRLLLPPSLSLVIALSGALGTQVWSTASRGLWSHTWATLLAGLVVWMLLSDETGRRKINPIVLASLLAWLYFVRPTGSLIIVVVTVYLASRWGVLGNRPKGGPSRQGRITFLQYALTGGLWLTIFVVYSWIHFGKLLPSYYQTNRIRFDLLTVALAGNLFSPSRGIFVYVPVILFVIYLTARYWKQLSCKGLVWLSLSICGLHILFVSAFANLWGDWWGGASFGPRYSTELVPWFALLGIISIRAWREPRSYQAFTETQAKSLRYTKGWAEVLLGVILLGASMFINARGAISLDTWKWSQPSTDQQLRALLWDWRHPQFLAGLQRPAPPTEFPIVQPPAVIDFTRPEAGKYLWYGWSGPEKDLRWSDGREATVIFALNVSKDMWLDVKLAPFLGAPRLLEQRIVIDLNSQPLEALSLRDGEIKSFSIRLPKNILAERNVVTFKFPDAASPVSLGVGTDDRLLGVRVESMQFRLSE